VICQMCNPTLARCAVHARCLDCSACTCVDIDDRPLHLMKETFINIDVSFIKCNGLSYASKAVGVKSGARLAARPLDPLT